MELLITISKVTVVLLSVCHFYQDLKLHMDLPEFTKKFKFYLSIINKFTLKKCMQCISSSIKMPSGQTMHCDSKQCVAKPNNALQLPWALNWWTAGREQWWEIRKWTIEWRSKHEGKKLLVGKWPWDVMDWPWVMGNKWWETKINKEKTKQMSDNMFLQKNKMHINDRRLN